MTQSAACCELSSESLPKTQQTELIGQRKGFCVVFSLFPFLFIFKKTDTVKAVCYVNLSASISSWLDHPLTPSLALQVVEHIHMETGRRPNSGHTAYNT